MGKRLIVAAGLVLCASLASAASVRVTATRANVRSEPSVTASVIGTVAQGRTLTVIVTVSDWIKVTDGTSTGWIHKSLVEEVPDSAAARPLSAPAKETREEASSTASSRPTPRARKTTSSDDKKIALGVGGSFATRSIGFGLHGRVIVSPVQSLPALRGLVEADYFLKGDLAGPLRLTLNAAYAFPESDSGFRPYVGGGLFFMRAGGETFTDLDLSAGVEYQQKFFLDGRLVFSDPDSHFILSAGIRF